MRSGRFHRPPRGGGSSDALQTGGSLPEPTPLPPLPESAGAEARGGTILMSESLREPSLNV